MHAGVIALSGSDDEGFVRGVFKTTWAGYNLGTADSGTWIESAWIAWKPIDQIEFFLGQDGDGKFQNSNLTRWGFHRMPRGISAEGWDGHGYILGGWDGAGAALTVSAIDLVTFHFVLNLADRSVMGQRDMVRWEDIWEGGHIQVSADFSLDFGRINLTYRDMNHWPTSDGKMIGASLHSSSLIEGIELEFGGNYRLDDEKNPVRLGLGVFWNGGDFGVKFRSLMRFPGSSDDRLYIVSDIMPWYQAEFGEIRLSIRLLVDQTGDNDPTIGWHVNPYLIKNVGPMQFRVGIMLEDDNGDEKLTFKLPISMILSF
jgi:hypothetical protein